MDLVPEILSYLDNIGGVQEVFDNYNLDYDCDEDDLESELQDDDSLNYEVCEVIYHNSDNVIENTYYLGEAVSDGLVETSRLGELLCDGNWAELETIIRNVMFNSEVHFAVSDWWTAHEDEIEELQNEGDGDEDEDDDDSPSTVELSDEEYDEGFEESMRRPRRVRYHK